MNGKEDAVVHLYLVIVDLSSMKYEIHPSPQVIIELLYCPSAKISAAAASAGQKTYSQPATTRQRASEKGEVVPISFIIVHLHPQPMSFGHL